MSDAGINGEDTMFIRPVWKDSAPYRALESASLERIAWEFLRRSNDYQKSWSAFCAAARKIAANDDEVAKYVDVFVAHRESDAVWNVLGDQAHIGALVGRFKKLGFSCEDPMHPGRVNRLDAQYGERWGLNRIVHPATAYDGYITRFRHTGNAVSMPTAHGLTSLVKLGGLQSLSDTKWLPLLVDLSLPLKVIDAQLKEIVRLERGARTRDGTVQPINNRDVSPKRYAEYIRILDAHADGFEAPAIGAALEPMRTNHQESRQRDKRYAAALIEAKRLQTDGYRTLPLLEYRSFNKKK